MPLGHKNSVHSVSDMKISASRLRRTQTFPELSIVCTSCLSRHADPENNSGKCKFKSRKTTLIWRLLQIINKYSKSRVKSPWYGLTSFRASQPLMCLQSRKYWRYLSARKFTYSSVGFRLIFRNIFNSIQLLRSPFKITSPDDSIRKTNWTYL